LKRQATSTGSPTPAKRGRNLKAQQVLRSGAKDEDDDTAGTLAELQGSDEEAGTDADAEKHCSGCQRSSTSGKCWIRPEDPVAWHLPELRGLWCRDCHSVWRLRFQNRMPLVTLPAHFRSKEAIQCEFDLGLVAFISLRRQGLDRVSGPALAERMEMVEWLLAAFGVPLRSFVVMPLAEVPSTTTASQLVTLKISSGFQLGALVCGSQRPGDGRVQRPLDSTGMNLLSKRFLFTNSPGDLPKLAEMFGDAPSGSSTSTPASSEPLAVKVEPDCPTVQLTKSGKKVSQKVKTAISGANLLLHNFEGTEWEDMRERNFSSPLARLMEAKLEAAHEQVESLIVEAEKWHDALCDAKLFAKKYREAMRSKSGQTQDEKLGQMSEKITKLWGFLKEHFKPHVSFSLVVLRCNFLSDAGDRDITERLRGIMDSGMILVLEAYEGSSPAGQGLSDGWLRSVLIGHIAGMVNNMKGEHVETERKRLGKMCGEVVNALQTSSLADALKGIIMDISMVQTLCSAGPGGGTKFGDIQKAEDHILGTPRLALLRAALTCSPGGMELTAPLTEMRSVSATDDLGDQRFSMGMSCFADQAMLTVNFEVGIAGAHDEVQARPKLTIWNGDLALGNPMMVVSMITDCMSNVVESIKLWSALRFEKSEDRLIEFLENVANTIAAAELTLLFELYTTCGNACTKLALSTGGDTKELESLAMAVGVAYKNVTAASTSQIVDQFGNLAASIQNSEKLSGLLQAHLETARTNDLKRSQLCKVFDSIAALVSAGLPSSVDAAIEQWSIRGDRSCVAYAVALVTNVEKLKAVQNFDFCHLFGAAKDEQNLPSLIESVVVVHDSEAGAADAKVRVQFSDLIGFTSAISQLPLVAWAQSLVKNGISALMDKLVVMTELEGILTGEVTDTSDQSSLAAITSSFVVPDKLTTSIAAVTKMLAASTDDLPSRAALLLLKSLISAACADTVTVGPGIASKGGDLPADIMAATCSLYVDTHHVAASLAWIGSTCLSGCTSNHKLKPELEIVLDTMYSNMAAAMGRVAKHEDLWLQLGSSSVKLKVAPLACASWLERMQEVFSGLCSLVLSNMVCSIQHLTKLVRSHTPGYCHFVNDKTCTVKLIKSRLLNFSSKTVLVNESVSLFNCLAEVSRFRDKYGLQVEQGSEDEHAEALALASSAFADSKKLMNIIAASHVAFQMSGSQQHKEASDWLKHKATELPKALVAELQKAASRGPAAVPAGLKDALKT